ncbi:MAG: dihydrodipicolinate synthase family protein [Paludibacter sp.]|jgi:4-hydroxy-tetrahydrodipicolinate synthase|nr:dihydrodipicolinate synthase family protein [Paludibacter sp.]
MKYFSGVVVPMITPFTKSLQIDTEAVKRIMAVFAENNISPLVAGTTGESSSLSQAAAYTLVKTAVEHKTSTQKVYAGLVCNCIEEMLDRAEQYADLAVDAIVATLPSYYSLTDKQMERFYCMLADASRCPVMMYNIKSTTQMSLPEDVVERLSEHPNIAGLKDSERDENRMKRFIEKFRSRSDFSYFSGWGAQALNALLLGADGVVPSTGNVVPEMYKELYAAYQSGDIENAKLWQQRTDDVAKIYQQNRTLGESLAALKVLMHSRGFCEIHVMNPLTDCEELLIVES